MKKREIGFAIMYCILVTILGLLAASFFLGCNIYENETVEVVSCPVVDVDTIQIPDWEIQK